MDTLSIKEKIEKNIELGESQFREFKSALQGQQSEKKPRDPKSVAKDIAETLVAFANADGGELLVGVEDDGVITGHLFKEEVVTYLLEVTQTGIHQDTPLQSPVARTVSIAGTVILYFAVEKSTQTVHQTSDGRCLQRKDRENRPVSAIHLQFERQEQVSREYDRQFVDNADLCDLDSNVLKRVSDHITKGMSPEKCLQLLGLAEWGMSKFRLRRAALLLFASKIGHWHPRCEVKIVRVKGTELRTGKDYNASPDELATGNIFELVSTGWEKLRPHLVETKLAADALFKERIMYPENACQEALINAITHRDYSIEGRNIEILIFDDRMEVHSPGGLLSTVKIDELKKLQGIHESRNALIARTLREIGYVREMGEGMRRIFSLMREADLVAPELHSNHGRFTITLRHKSVFSDSDQRWLDGFKPLKLTREEMHVMLLGHNGNMLSPQQIYDSLNLVDWDVYREIIEQMQIKGLLFNAVSQQQKVTMARKNKVSQREIPRIIVRQPDECENGLKELFDSLRKNSTTHVTNSYFAQLQASLPKACIYQMQPIRLAQLLKLLGLIDQERRPTTLLLNLWKTNSSEKHARQSPAPLSSSTSTPTSVASNKSGPCVQPAETSIYVGNLSYTTTEEDLSTLYATYGSVVSVRVLIDFYTAKSRGCAFVIMASQLEADHAIRCTDGMEFMGRCLRVELAQSRPPKLGRFGSNACANRNRQAHIK